MHESSGSAVAPAHDLHGVRAAVVLTVLCATQFMVVLDTTIVNVALPSIQVDLGFASQSDLQYVVSLYALTFGGFLVLGGRLADLYGRRRLLVLGLGVFMIASLACGLAAGPVTMLVGRAVQGLGSAMVSPAALSLLTASFREGSARHRALAAWGAAGGAAGACGLLVGGLLTAAWGWEWVFFINVPIGLAAIVAALRVVEAGRDAEAGAALDLGGALTVTLAVGLLILGFSHIERAGLSASTVAMFAGAVLAGAIFVVLERRVRTPIVEFRLFGLPGVAGANVAVLLLSAVVASQLFFTTLHVQRVLGFSALGTGLVFLPNSAMVVLCSTTASPLVGRLGARRVLAAGLALIAVGAALQSTMSGHGSVWTAVLPGFTLSGAGLGLAFVAATIQATNGTGPRDQGLASGIVNSAQQIGFAVGIAAIVSAAMAVGRAGGPAAPGDLAGLVASFRTGFAIDAVIAGLAALLALGVPWRARRADTTTAGRSEYTHGAGAP